MSNRKLSLSGLENDVWQICAVFTRKAEATIYLLKQYLNNLSPIGIVLVFLFYPWVLVCFLSDSLKTAIWDLKAYNLLKKRFTYPFLSATALFIWRLSSIGSNGLGCCRVDVSVKSLNFIVGSQHSPSSSWSKLQAPNPHHAYLLFLLAIRASVFSALTSTCSYWLKQQPEPLDFSSTIFLSVLSREH